MPWESRGANLATSLLALLRGPAPPQGWPLNEYFHDAWLRGRTPWRALVTSVLWHVVLVIFPILPLHAWVRLSKPEAPEPRKYEITWSGPIRDLPPYIPPGPRRKSSPPGNHTKQPPPKGADAFHPRQTIVSAPEKITHPRQTLIQPDKPPEPPKILPLLPNVVEWTETPKPPKPRLDVNAHARLRTKVPRRKRLEEMPAPDVPATPGQPSDVTLPLARPSLVRPKLEVQRTAGPRFRSREATPETNPAPDAAPSQPSDPDAQRLVALSPFPSPPPPTLEVPPGNLGARFSVSPEGGQGGVPGGSASANGGSGGSENGGEPGRGVGGNGGGGKGPGIPGISISGGQPENLGSVSGLGGTLPALPGRARSVMPAKPEPRADGTLPSRARNESILDRLKPGSPPEGILESKRIYTLHVNMPNLTSATGSWVLKFVELNEEEKQLDPGGAITDLAGPVPVHKVDPKYPPALVSARIQGEVVLYAIIRRDGTVDSIQLIRGLDPQLDQNAMEALARWKFRAAERKGKPVELEAIVRIPFRAVASLY